MAPRFISFEDGDTALDWLPLTDALAAGHALPKAEITDSFLYRKADTLLNRAAWIDGLGLLVKSATIFPENRAVPTVNGGVSLYSDTTGTLEAVIDFHLVTKWKTAGDSLLAARKLARPDTQEVLIVGSGTVARSLHSAYSALFPQARFTVWSRKPQNAEALAQQIGAEPMADLETAFRRADVVTSATMADQPFLKGAWLRPGQHIDLIGAYRPDMREADDALITGGKLFVDSKDTTIGHIGEIETPLQNGILKPDDIRADYYDLNSFIRSPEDITIFKNGGGAHLDLMTATHILKVCG